jgi:penicillin-binding protein 1C
MVAAYAAFARGGEWLEPSWRRAPVASRARRQLVSPRTAYWISDILSDPEAREYIFGRGGNLELPFPVAEKTGTSQAYHDNWTIGYTRDVTVGVWVGIFDRTPLRDSTGVTGAGPVFHAVMLAAQRRAGTAEDGFVSAAITARPDDLQEREICVLSGMPANPWCPSKRREHVPAGEAAAPCSWHHESDDGLITVWPAEYREWARKAGLLRKQPTVTNAVVVTAVHVGDVGHVGHVGQDDRGTPAALSIASPPSGATYLIDPTLRREFQTLPLRAVTARAGPLDWRVDGRPFGTSAAGIPLDWPLTPGAHVITVRDARGGEAEARVVVR